LRVPARRAETTLSQLAGHSLDEITLRKAMMRRLYVFAPEDCIAAMVLLVRCRERKAQASPQSHVGTVGFMHRCGDAIASIARVPYASLIPLLCLIAIYECDVFRQSS